jgi:hypothetical protein
MDDPENQSTETWTFKQGWPELVAGLVVLAAFSGYLLYADHPMSLNFYNRWLSLLAGVLATSIGLLGLLQKRAFRRGLIYKGAPARRISLLYLLVGLAVCAASFILLRG